MYITSGKSNIYLSTTSDNDPQHLLQCKGITVTSRIPVINFWIKSIYILLVFMVYIGGKFGPHDSGACFDVSWEQDKSLIHENILSYNVPFLCCREDFHLFQFLHNSLLKCQLQKNLLYLLKFS